MSGVTVTTMDFFGSKLQSHLQATLGSAKQLIKSRIVEAIKDLQIEYCGQVNQCKIIDNNESSNRLVASLEALFIHGMKDSLMGKLSSAVFGGGVAHGTKSLPTSASSAKLPEPNFWMFVLIFSHSDTIARIENLSQVNTDVGKGRSWIRLALNEGLLASYLQAMQKDRVSARKLYHRFALIRDHDMLDVITKYILGIEIYQFDLALNSALLNRWQTAPLVMAGLWTQTVPALSDAAVAVDVASTLPDADNEEGIDPLVDLADEDRDKTNEVQSSSGIQYIGSGLLNEDEALKIILRGQSLSSSSSTNNSPIGSPPPPTSISKMLLKKRAIPVPSSQGPLLSGSPRNAAPLLASSLGHQAPNAAVATGSLTVAPLGDQIKQEQALAPDEQEQIEQLPAPAILGEVLSTTRMDSDLSDVEDSIYSIKNSGDAASSDSLKASSDPPGWATALSSPVKSEVVPQSDLEGHRQPEMTIQAEAAPVDEDEDSWRPDLAKGSLDSDSLSSNTSLVLAVPHLAGFIESWNPFGSDRYFDTPPDVCAGVQCGFTLKPNVRVGALNEKDSQELMCLFDQVVREQGLDSQNYECAECSKAIGSLFGPAKICAYTKKYFCQECHRDEVSVIPARVVYGWQFLPLRVSHKAKVFLDHITIEPIVHIKSFNDALFQFASDLEHVRGLRRKLKYMKAYLMTCSSSGIAKVREELQRLLWPRPYLCDDVDMYSIQDFEDVRTSRLKPILLQAIKFSQAHILSCILCVGKGFICEVCRDPQPIYPFDLDQITQCPKCFTVFHANCSVQLSHCPKCDRIEARNLNWLVGSAKASRHHHPDVEPALTPPS